jgi:hypothetical protein
MGSEAADRQVNILLFDVAAEWKGEGLLDKFGVLSSSEGPKGGVSLVAVLRLKIRIEDDVVL